MKSILQVYLVSNSPFPNAQWIMAIIHVPYIKTFTARYFLNFSRYCFKSNKSIIIALHYIFRRDGTDLREKKGSLVASSQYSDLISKFENGY